MRRKLQNGKMQTLEPGDPFSFFDLEPSESVSSSIK